jgi:hypothetical protein
MIKTHMKLVTEGMYLNIIKSIYENSIADIKLNGEKLKPFSLKSGRRQRCPLFALIQRNLGIPSQSNEVGRKVKAMQSGKEENQTISICS